MPNKADYVTKRGFVTERASNKANAYVHNVHNVHNKADYVRAKTSFWHARNLLCSQKRSYTKTLFWYNKGLARLPELCSGLNQNVVLVVQNEVDYVHNKAVAKTLLCVPKLRFGITSFLHGISFVRQNEVMQKRSFCTHVINFVFPELCCAVPKRSFGITKFLQLLC